MSITTTVVLSAIAATIMAALGYLKSMGDEDFQPEKLISTYLAAFVVAILLVAFNVPTATGSELFYYFVMQSGAIVYIERTLKFIWRTYILPYIPE